MDTRYSEFTLEQQARLRNTCNKPFIVDYRYWNQEASKDNIIHFAHGIGDNNPLFTDEDYARKTKYGRLIAQPCYLYSVFWLPMEALAATLYAWYSGGDWEWYRPIYVGDTFKTVCVMRDLVKKKSRNGQYGDTFIAYSENIYINQRNEIVAKEIHHTVSKGRASKALGEKYRNLTKPVYTRQDWEKILALYENEEVRGGNPRFWEDVKIGDQLGPMVKGPLMVRDILGWLLGAGSPLFKAHKIEYEFERTHPRVLQYIEETGEADVPELVHIFDSFARGTGIERAYDYGHQRMSWLSNLFTNWAGDDGFLYKMSGDLRAFNLVGDLTTFNGKVVEKYIDKGKCCVDIEAWATNQRREKTMPPSVSTVILPSREFGPVVYPDASPELEMDVKRARPLKEMREAGIF